METTENVEQSENIINWYEEKHAEYATVIFNSLMRTQRMKFINKYKFNGDDKFKTTAQQTMLGLAFDRGVAGMHNINKSMFNQIVKASGGKYNGNVIRNYLNDKYKELGGKFPIGAYGEITRSIDNEIVDAIASTISFKTDENKVYDTNRDDTAYLIFGFNYDNSIISGYEYWKPYLWKLAYLITVLKAKSSFVNFTLGVNAADGSAINDNFKNIGRIENITLALDKQNETDDKMNKDIGKMGNNIIGDELKKIDFSSGEDINAIMTLINDWKMFINHSNGERINTNQKKEKNIMSEFTGEEINFKLMEKQFDTNMQLFCDNYKRVFGVEIKYVNVINELIEEDMQKMMDLSGRKDDMKGDSNVKNNNNNKNI